MSTSFWMDSLDIDLLPEAFLALPVFSVLPHVHVSLQQGHNLVVQAEPGAGKSTLLPLSLLGAPWLQGKTILMLEPRRIAAKSIACFLAQQLGESVGERVGYQIRQERRISKCTRLEIITEGILTRRLQTDPEMRDVGLIIFDEFHERSLHCDLALQLGLEVQQTIRDDLRLLVMSATLDTQSVADYLQGADIISCPGRAHPVEVLYRAPSESLVGSVMSALQWALAQPNQGDILVFLPGQKAIQQCLANAQAEYAVEANRLCLPLYGGLSIEQQQQAILPDAQGRQRVIFTTNIAETSLTIQGVTCVIDSGLEKVLSFDPVSAMTRLSTERISQASTQQRAGRAGRIRPGQCLRLWSKQEQETRRAFQKEAILSEDLSGLLLELVVWGHGQFDAINWLTPPPKAHFDSAFGLLVALGLIQADTQQATPLGKQAAQLAVTPRLAAMLLQAESKMERDLASDVAAILSERDLAHQGAGVDLLDRLLVLQDDKSTRLKGGYRKGRNGPSNAFRVHYPVLAQVLKGSQALHRSLKWPQADAVWSLSDLQTCVPRLLLKAFPDRLARCRSANSNRYQLANGRGVFLPEGDSLSGAEWLVVADCDGQKKEGRIFSAVSLSSDEVLAQTRAGQTEAVRYYYDRNLDKVVGRRVRAFGALTLQEWPVDTVPPEAFQQCIVPQLQQNGLNLLNWTPECQQWLERAQWLGAQLPDFPALSEAILLEQLENWLLPYMVSVHSLVQLKRLDLMPLLQGILSWPQQQKLEAEAPAQYQTPAGKWVRIVYDGQQGPLVSVVLQEMFGELDSPRLAAGQIPLRFELLSPARRPIQTTSDLRHFWHSSYFEVRKDMKGRYPKHRWPDDPLSEKPGKSLKGR